MNGDHEHEGHPPDEAAGTPDEVVDAELLSDAEVEYVGRWMAHDRALRAGERPVSRAASPAVPPEASPTTVIARRREGGLAPRRTDLGHRAGVAGYAARRWVVGRIVRPTSSAWRRTAQELIRSDSRARWTRVAMATETARWVGAVVAAVGALLWLVDTTMGRADMWPWLARMYETIRGATRLAGAALPFVVAAAVVGWLVASAREGRDHAPGAGFLVRPDREDTDSWIDERMISQALAHLGITPLDRFFKSGGRLVYTVAARLDGDGTYAPIMERNYLIGGQPGQGKSSAGRTLRLGCALDPTVELRVYVFATNPDFDPFRPRLTRYVKSDDDDAIAAGLAELQELREDVTRRGELLERHGAAKVTRTLADTVRGLHPKMVIFDECHEMFEHRTYGEEARALAIKVVKKARKCGITLIFLTQSPTAASIPKDLTRNCSNGVAFAVADQVANDGLLGSGAYRQGIRVTELRPGDDRGTAVTVGFTAHRFELIGTFYVAFDESGDEVTPVVARAIALLDRVGRAVPAPSIGDGGDEENAGADHLADLNEVVRGEVRVRTQMVLRRLAELNAAEYGDWSFARLAEALAEHGLTARKYNGVMVVRAAEVAAALHRRDADTDDDVSS